MKQESFDCVAAHLGAAINDRLYDLRESEDLKALGVERTPENVNAAAAAALRALLPAEGITAPCRGA